MFRCWLRIVPAFLVGVYLAWGPLPVGHAVDAPDLNQDASQSDFFERKIRPVFVAHCYACHSAESGKSEGGLRLDSAAGLRQGGDRGPVVIAKDPAASLLLSALRYEELEMPPDGKLPAEIIDDFATWISLGAADPRETSAAPTPPHRDQTQLTSIAEAARQHWAFQPIHAPRLPDTPARSWGGNAIDRFVLARLSNAGLTPSPPADDATIVRRVYLDLWGIPPQREDVTSYTANRSPDKLTHLVDRLLSGPAYGQRWARHWLDVARYADTKDQVLVYGKDAIRPYAYTYRDYVVRAFNEDLPFDQFILQQIAADQMEPRVEPWQHAALGFLTLGRMYDNNPHDIYDDQIDVVTRGFMGLTVTCARCHDHKYDAIPTADYYSLFGVFANSHVPVELPQIEPVDGTPQSREYTEKSNAKLRELREHIASQHAEIISTARGRTHDYLTTIATQPPSPLEEAVFFMSLSPEDLRPKLLSRWRRYLRNQSSEDPVFGLWHDLSHLPDAEWPTQASRVVAQHLGRPMGLQPSQINPTVHAALSSASIHSRGDVAAFYAQVLLAAYEIASNPARQTEQTDAVAQLARVLTSHESPLYIPLPDTYLYMSRIPRDKYHQMQLELDKLAVYGEHVPARAMVLADNDDLRDPHILVRGNPGQVGPAVPRQFLQLLSPADRKPFRQGSGRLDLAQAIAAPTNPLTARVLVNRVWMHHFGEPLVDTPSDFGLRSNPPTHPELLDYLASEFMAHGWSLKWLHREILTSQTFQQSSRNREEYRAIDPYNRMLWRFHRQRMDFETMRDAMLATAHRLDLQMGGRPVDIAGDPLLRRRTIYALVDRQNLPGVFRVFDFASPDQSAQRRPQTIVPQQALYMLNSPFMLQIAKSLSEEVTRKSSDRTDQVQRLYESIYARPANEQELALAIQFLDSSPSPSTWEQLAQVLLSANEFLYVD